MEHIGNILNQMENPTNGRKPQANQKTQVDQCHCETCGSDFQAEVTTYCIGRHERSMRPRECSACKAKREAEEVVEREEWLKEDRAEQREKWRRQCGMPGHLLSRSTFSAFEASYQDKAYKNCLKYAQGLNLDDTLGYRSLILYSPKPGVGKTHLMVAIANYAIDQWNGEPEADSRCPIRFEKGPGLVLRIRSTFSIRDNDNRHEREDEIYRELKGVRLLLLDDVGKEAPSKFTRQLYWTIIDERVTSGLPIVMTCRLSLDALSELMGEDAVDRLYGMTGGQIETLAGESYRKLNKTA